MKKIEKRGAIRDRRSKAGETLTETLIAMLIVGLSSVLFLTMTGAAGRISRKAETEYDNLYEKIISADAQTSVNALPNGKITVSVSNGSATTQVSVSVDWYGSEDYVLSYKAR